MTEAPVVPFDGCNGVLCSGHGKCRMNANQEGICHCFPGPCTCVCARARASVHACSCACACARTHACAHLFLPGCRCESACTFVIWLCAGWFRRDCDDTPLRLSKLEREIVSECGGSALVSQALGVQTLSCDDTELLATSETTASLTILTSPEADVTCTLESSMPQEAAVLNPVVIFSAGDAIRSSVLISISGMIDGLMDHVCTPCALRLRQV